MTKNEILKDRVWYNKLFSFLRERKGMYMDEFPDSQVRIYLFALAGLTSEQFLDSRLAAKDFLVEKGFAKDGKVTYGEDERGFYIDIIISYFVDVAEIAGAFWLSLDCVSSRTQHYNSLNQVDVWFQC